MVYIPDGDGLLHPSLHDTMLYVPLSVWCLGIVLLVWYALRSSLLLCIHGYASLRMHLTPWIHLPLDC